MLEYGSTGLDSNREIAERGDTLQSLENLALTDEGLAIVDQLHRAQKEALRRAQQEKSERTEDQLTETRALLKTMRN